MSVSENDEDAPLDPALIRVQQKLRRLMLIGGLTLAIGIAAVFAAIVYRIAVMDDKGGPAGQPVADIVLPAGAHLVSSSLDGRRMLLVYEHPGGTLALLIDIDKGQVVGRTELHNP